MDEHLARDVAGTPAAGDPGGEGQEEHLERDVVGGEAEGAGPGRAEGAAEPTTPTIAPD